MVPACGAVPELSSPNQAGPVHPKIAFALNDLANLLKSTAEADAKRKAESRRPICREWFRGAAAPRRGELDPENAVEIGVGTIGFSRPTGVRPNGRAQVGCATE